MILRFSEIHRGQSYSRNKLAELWGYASFHALARGVVTPKDDNKIILFVTEEKQADAEPYDDALSGDRLRWEGPNDHYAEDRMANASHNGTEIHLFHRDQHHRDFIYLGELRVIAHQRHTDRPSRFTFQLI